MALTLRFDRERLVSAVPQIPVFIIFPSRICSFFGGIPLLRQTHIYLNHPESKRCLSGRQWKLCQGVSKKRILEKMEMAIHDILTFNEMFVDQNEMYHKSVWGEMTCTFTQTAPQ
jgi:hypothetical protein